MALEPTSLPLRLMIKSSPIRCSLVITTLGVAAACSAPAPGEGDNGAGTGGAVSAGGTNDLGAGGAATGNGGAAQPGVGGSAPGSGGEVVSPGAGGTVEAAGGTGIGGSPEGAGGVVESAGGAAAEAGGSLGSGGDLAADPCDSAAICDDFEGGMDAGWIVQPDSVPAPVIDTTKAKNGSSSLKVTGTSQQAFVAFPVPAQAFYTRAYMNFEQNTLDMSGHGWFVVAADNVTSGGESQIRFGSSTNHGHAEVDMNFYAPTCGGGEKTQFSDGASDGGAGWNGETTDRVNFTAGQWYCVEVYFNGPGNEAQVWVDRSALPGLHVTEASMCAGWAPNFTHIKFGAGANGNIGSIWYDDVAVSTTRIGCD